ncbi:MAG: epoxyqueuosine reductase QueH, partial [Lachnospiraceae bacterium]|nr:epoxyqueuosine reductase QueH [Lachnospiraceae bacterium]
MNQRNYQRELDRILEELPRGEKKLFLHSCCAPCSSYVLEYLTQFFDITLLFYGPNIQPREEY